MKATISVMFRKTNWILCLRHHDGYFETLFFNKKHFEDFNKNHLMKAWPRRDLSAIIKYHFNELRSRLYKSEYLGVIEIDNELDFDYITNSEEMWV